MRGEKNNSEQLLWGVESEVRVWITEGKARGFGDNCQQGIGQILIITIGRVLLEWGIIGESVMKEGCGGTEEKSRGRLD